jgi:hypothetical protein
MIVNLEVELISEPVANCHQFNSLRSQSVTLNKYVRKPKSRRHTVETSDIQNLRSQIANARREAENLSIMENLKVLGYEH